MQLPPFILRPFDAMRPRLHAPRADFVIEGAKTYLAREANGLLFLRDIRRDDAEFTLAVGAPIPDDIARAGLAPTFNYLPSDRLEEGASPAPRSPNHLSGDQLEEGASPTRNDEELRRLTENASPTPQISPAIQSWAAAQIASGNVARYVLLPFRAPHLFREFPLFFRPDGTGFCREGWNRDDFAFEHDLSLHDWLEARATALHPSVAEIFRREVAPQLANARLPADRNHALAFGNGARADLRAVLRAAFALESLGNNGIIRVTGQSESLFDRAGFWAARGEGGEVEVWFDPLTGERFRKPWKPDSLRLSRRFWMLGDLAIDATTPTGLYWDYHDEGRGRMSETPHSRDFSLQFIADKLPSRDEARAWLQNWLASIGADSAILDWDETEVFKEREPEPQQA